VTPGGVIAYRTRTMLVLSITEIVRAHGHCDMVLKTMEHERVTSVTVAFSHKIVTGTPVDDGRIAEVTK
jgi:hypothetical protein